MILLHWLPIVIIMIVNQNLSQEWREQISPYGHKKKVTGYIQNSGGY